MRLSRFLPFRATPTGPVASRAEVGTDAAPRYAKQLLSHLGRKAATDGDVLILDAGTCRMVPGEGVLVMEAEAAQADLLLIVQDVVGRHLERFGQKDGLSVTWTPAP